MSSDISRSHKQYNFNSLNAQYLQQVLTSTIGIILYKNCIVGIQLKFQLSKFFLLLRVTNIVSF